MSNGGNGHGSTSGTPSPRRHRDCLGCECAEMLSRHQLKLLNIERDMGIYIADVREVKEIVRSAIDEIAADNVRTTNVVHDIVGNRFDRLELRIDALEAMVKRIAKKVGA